MVRTTRTLPFFLTADGVATLGVSFEADVPDGAGGEADAHPPNKAATRLTATTPDRRFILRA